MLPSDKVLFEIYRDARHPEEFRVIYFTELNEHNRDAEFDKAMQGEHLYDGFIRSIKLEKARESIAALLERLNQGEALTSDNINHDLAEFLAG